MLKLRIITALVLLPLVVFGTLYASTSSFAIAVTIVVTLAAWEWSRLVGFTNSLVRLLYISVLPAMAYFLFTTPAAGQQLQTAMLSVSVVWLVLLFFINLDPVSHLGRLNKSVYKFVAAILGWLLLTAMWWAFITIHQLEAGPGLIMGLFLLVWSADTGAYFAGRQWGRHKLAPRVSPGKTWEGVFGGLILALCVAALTPYILQLSSPGLPVFMGIAVVTVVISIYGDLLESVIKRVAGVKDSGRILPGHGGILDRIDSLIAAAPVFLSGLLLFGNTA